MGATEQRLREHAREAARAAQGPDPAWEVYERQDDGRRRFTGWSFQRPDAQAQALRCARQGYGDRGEIYPKPDFKSIMAQTGGCFHMAYLDDLKPFYPVDDWIRQQAFFQQSARGISLPPDESDDAPAELPPELPE